MKTGRSAHFSFYQKELKDLPGVHFVNEPSGFYSNRWLTTILVNPGESGGITREDIRLALERENIESRPLWKPMNLQPVFKEFPYCGEKVAETLFENGLCLPSGSNLLQEDLERVLKCIMKIFKK